MPDPLATLCAELGALYRDLGAALRPGAGDEPDRSSVMRPALLWCAQHAAAHHRDEWTDGCTPGQDPRRATAAGIGPALVATAAAGAGRRPVPGSRPPLDMGVLAAQEAIWTAAADLAEDVRYQLGWADRPLSGTRALVALPDLVEAVPEASAGRWLTVGLARLQEARAGARRVLGLDPVLLELGPCPSVRDDYPAAWTADGQGALAVWTDGLCRRYDATASARASRETGRPADVWHRAHLAVDPAAGTLSPEGDIRCRACGRRWAGEVGRRELWRLLADERESA